MQTLVLHFEKIEDVAHPFCAGNTVAEYDAGLAFVLGKIVVHVQVFFFFFASNSEFIEGVGHALFLSKVNYFGVARPELKHFAKLVYCGYLFFELDAFFLGFDFKSFVFLNASRGNTSLLINR